jgi:hypothetical protein
MCTASNRILCCRLCLNKSEVTHKEIGEDLNGSGGVEADAVGGWGGVEAKSVRRLMVG